MDLSQLQVSITPHLLSPPDPQLKMDLTVHNHFEHAVTVQIWDSPLDPRCALLSVIEILDTAANTLLPLDKVYLGRQMPPPPESFVEIGSHQQATNIVTIRNVKLDAGKEYRVEAKGRWKAVWDNAIEKIDSGMAEHLAGANAGDFVSNSVVIRPE